MHTCACPFAEGRLNICTPLYQQNSHSTYRNVVLLRGMLSDSHCGWVLTLHFDPFRTPRGTKSVESIVRSILSNVKPFVVPENPEDTLQVLKDLANRVVYLEKELETLQKREHEQQHKMMEDSPSSSTTVGSPRPPANTYYTPVYTPAHVESEHQGPNPGYEEHETEPPVANLVKAVINQLAVSTPAPAHLQSEELEQHLREPENSEVAWNTGTGTSEVGGGDLWPCRSIGEEAVKAGSLPPTAHSKRKEFWNVHSVSPPFIFLFSSAPNLLPVASWDGHSRPL